MGEAGDRQSEIAVRIKRMQWDNVQHTRQMCSVASGEIFAQCVGVHNGYRKVLELLCSNPHEGAPDVCDLIRAVEDRNYRIPL